MKHIYVAGTAQHIQRKYSLDLFSQVNGYDRFYAAGDPNTTLHLADGEWSGTTAYGSSPGTITFWLVDLPPKTVKEMNKDKAFDRHGFPRILGTILATIHFTAR